MSQIPDAWDDDYEAIVDSQPKSQPPNPPCQQVSRAERKAQHQESNKQLWNSAENPEINQFVESHNASIPLKPAYKAPLKVLSRKPTKPTSLENGTHSLTLNNDEIDSDEEERRSQDRALKDKQAKAAEERAEKQRKYAEVRERLFGTSKQESEDTTGRDSPIKRGGGRQRGRGAKTSGRSGRDSQHPSSTEQSPARMNGNRSLYDPSDPSGGRSGVYQETTRPGNIPTSKPIREPKGPDGSGRGGFAPRGKPGS